MGQSSTSVRRVAFFGGSFDPPHLGHLAVARAAREALELDYVLFAPVGVQPLKPEGSSASFEDRVAMVRLAIAHEPHFELSLADAPRAAGVPNFTHETLQVLRDELPRECTLYCLMGADSLAGIGRWHRAAEIPFVAPLIVASRPGQRLDELTTKLPAGLTLDPECESKSTGAAKSGVELRCYWIVNRDGKRTPFYLLPGLDVEISASRIREWAREPATMSGAGSMTAAELLPGPVAEYVRVHGLYR